MDLQRDYIFSGYEIYENLYSPHTEHCTGCGKHITTNEEVWEINELLYCEYCMLELESKRRSL